jgi:hypothetical protein
LAIAAALSESWAAFVALGFYEARDVFLEHLLTKLIDYGPSFFVALLIWVACHTFGARDAKFSVMVGVGAFYFAPRLYALIVLRLDPYWMPIDLVTLFTPRIGELGIGAILGLVMWAIGYWKPASEVGIAAEG